MTSQRILTLGYTDPNDGAEGHIMVYELSQKYTHEYGLAPKTWVVILAVGPDGFCEEFWTEEEAIEYAMLVCEGRIQVAEWRSK